METIRQQKMGRLLQKELSTLFQKEFPHLTKGSLVSVTVVRISSDFSYAKVYLSLFPVANANEAVQRFNQSVHEISTALYPIIRNQMRKMPEFKFFYDDSVDYAQRIDSLLKEKL